MKGLVLFSLFPKKKKSEGNSENIQFTRYIIPQNTVYGLFGFCTDMCMLYTLNIRFRGVNN